MEDPMQRLGKLLAQSGDSCEFVTSGILPPLLPGLEVVGAGPIGLPISDEEARRLIAVADQAPYGRGSETIVDTDVRRVWQIEPARFALQNPGWEAQMKRIVTAVKQRFGIKGKVRHELYKLLVYEAGSFFAPHRDTEKTPGMFATLVVCLPSRHEGGTLVVDHEGESVRVDFGGADSEFQTSYAAFYADCRHEITPVESGYRVCVVYNLALDRAHRNPSAPQNSAAVAKTAEVLRDLFATPSLELNKVVIPFEHQYTEAGLHPSALKGADKVRASVLARAAASLDYECSLALVTHYQSGSVDEGTRASRYYRSRRSYRRYHDEDEVDDDDEGADFEEIIDEFLTLDHWMDMEGRERPIRALHVEEDELLCREDREGWGFRQEIQEATGNEGATLERWYRHSAVVIWPRDRFFRILAAEGASVALPELERMVAAADDEEALAACRTFASAILNSWTPGLQPNEGEPWPSRMLALLERIGTLELVRQFVRNVLPRGFSGSEGAALSRLCERFGWEALRPDLEAFIERHQASPYQIDPNRLLMLLMPLYGEPATWTAERRVVCESLAQGLAGVLDCWHSAPLPAYLRKRISGAGFLAGAVRVFSLGMAPVALDQLLNRALGGELELGLHEDLGRDLKSIAEWLPEAPAALPAYTRLREHCLTQLRAATTARPEPPKDWARSAELGCKCPDCTALGRFLADPNAEAARFPLAEQRRMHLHDQIERHGCDCTHETERKGRPYTLVCAKTQASYERQEQQYQQNRKLLGEIEQLPAG